MNDLIVVGGELCAAENLVVSNEIAGVVSLACVVDMDFVVVSVDSLVVDVNEGFSMKHYVQSIFGSEHADWMI